MPAKDHEERVDRLEQIVGILAEDQQTLQTIVTELATETRRGFDQIAVRFEGVAAQFEEIGRRMDETDRHMRETDEHMRETDKHMRETDKHMRETDERMRRTDERWEKLIIAMGEFIRRN